MINKITLGDSYELIKKLENKSVDLVYIDVPYLMESGGKNDSGLNARIKQKMENDISDIRSGFDYSIFEELIRVSKKINIFIWCSKLQLLDIMNYWIKDNNCLFELLVWHKTNPTPQTNNTWLPDIEYCLHIKEKGVKLNDGYHLKSKCYASATNKNDKDDYGHPTIKPLELVKRHILHTTQENDVVLDCFSGSGTTAVACKELNRQFIAFEINEEYHKISVDRLNGISVKDRKDKENGIQSIFDMEEMQ